VVGAAALAAPSAAAAGAWRRARRAVADIEAQPDDTADVDLGPLDWPATTVRTDDGTRLHVVQQGIGPPVVLVHGYLGDTSTWALVGPRLVEAGFRVVAYDQRGHGRSQTVGEDGFGIEQIGHDLAAVLRALDLSGSVVTGHSMGGIALLSLAQHDPQVLTERVAAAVIASATACGPGRHPLVGLKRPLRQMAWFDRARRRRTLALWMAAGVFGPRRPLSLVTATWQAYLRTPVRTLNGAGEPLLEFDLRHSTAALTVPVTVVAGTADRVTPLRCSLNLVEAIPVAELLTLEAVGHLTPLEAPGEIVDAVVRQAGGAPHRPGATASRS
jgi:pimeloyl-ACP methyl ester carboxylesterase